MKKRIVSIMLAVCLLLSLAANGAASEASTSGEWENLKWSYDKTTHTMTISGTGEIPQSIGGDYDQCIDEAQKLVIQGGEDGEISIGGSAFSSCNALAHVEVTGNVGTIGGSAFSSCNTLAHVEVTGNVDTIDSHAFANCTNLTSFPSFGKIGTIKGNAFYNCTGFHRIALPDGGVDSIEGYAFDGCKNLTAIYIPDTVKKIDSSAFDDSLKDIYYAGGSKKWKGVFNGETPATVHYDSTKEDLSPDLKADSKESLLELIKKGEYLGCAEIELTGDIDMGSDILEIPSTYGILIDLKGHNITSSGNPAFKIAGEFTVTDSAANSNPTVGEDNSVTYDSGKINSSGTAVEIQPGGSFTLRGGTVKGSSSAPAIQLSGASGDTDSSGPEVCIDGGYVDAAGGTAIVASGNQASVTINGGVIRSGGEAVISLPKTSSHAQVRIEGGSLLNTNEDFSCGIYQAGSDSSSIIRDGKIVVKKGIGVLVRYGSLSIYDSTEISAGGSGQTGKFDGSETVLEAGHRVVLEQLEKDTGENHSIIYYLYSGDEFLPKAYPLEGEELKHEYSGYFFGPITVYKVTLDPNGAEGEKRQIDTNSSGEIKDLPEDLTRDGYVFRGWSEKPDAIIGDVKNGDKITEDITLYAVWTEEGRYLITYQEPDYPDRETMYGYRTRGQRLTNTDGVLEEWPNPEHEDRYGYKGDWYADPFDRGGPLYVDIRIPAKAYPRDHQFTKDTTIYARYVSRESTISFIVDEDSPDSNITRKTNPSGKVEDWPVPTREGYVFKGWQWRHGYAAERSFMVDEGYTFFQDTSLYAQWMPTEGYTVTFYVGDDPTSYYFDEANFKVYATRHANPKTAKLDDWPSNPPNKPASESDQREWSFVGWYDADFYHSAPLVTADYEFNRDTRLYARWELRDLQNPRVYVITFHYSDSESDDVPTDNFGRLSFLPYRIPVREGYTFAGWFTAPDGGDEVFAGYQFSSNTDVYPHWDAAAPPEPTHYTLTVEDGTIVDGGTSGKYEAGAEVHIKANDAPEGEVFDKWTTEDGVAFADAAKTETTITMPAKDVTVTATYKEATPPEPVLYTLTVKDGTIVDGGTSGKYEAGTEVHIKANDAPEREVFDKWTTEDGVDFADAAKTETTITMPAKDVTVTATYKEATPPEPVLYTLTVKDGTGGGQYKAGAEVHIKANDAPEGEVFDKWTTEDGVAFADAAKTETTITMPAKDVTVTATYKKATPPEPVLYTLMVKDGTGGGQYKAGAEVHIKANDAPEGEVFDKWTTEDGVAFTDAAKTETTITMPAKDVTVTATYKKTTPPEPVLYTLTVKDGTIDDGGTSGKYEAGAEVHIKANDAPEGEVFDKWTTEDGVDFADAAKTETTITMPAKDVTVTATYKKTAPPEPVLYTLTVEGGTGGGQYATGAKASIEAEAPAEGKIFDKWTTSDGGTFENASNAKTTFTMPANDVTVTAAYKDDALPEYTAYTVYFDSNGGTVSIASMVTGTNGRLPDLPVPVYYGYIFDGWYTSPTGGIRISTNTVFDRNAIVYAHWIPERSEESPSNNRYSPAAAAYAVIVPSAPGGTVTVSREYAAQGSAITVTVTPNSGYKMASLIARDSWWNELELTDRGGGKYTLTMPNRSVTINATFAAAAATTQQPVPVARPNRVWTYPGFFDVAPSAWYYDAVRFVYETGLMKGLNGTEFAPNANLSRAQLTQTLYNLAGSPAVSGITGFADVASGDWYANAVAWAVLGEMINGYEGGTFSPYDYVSREEIVAMLWRYAGKPASEQELYFNDTSNISTYALPAVRWAVEKGILNGNSNGALTPKGLATRSQFAQMLKNYVGG